MAQQAFGQFGTNPLAAAAVEEALAEICGQSGTAEIDGMGYRKRRVEKAVGVEGHGMKPCHYRADASPEFAQVGGRRIGSRQLEPDAVDPVEERIGMAGDRIALGHMQNAGHRHFRRRPRHHRDFKRRAVGMSGVEPQPHGRLSLRQREAKVGVGQAACGRFAGDDCAPGKSRLDQLGQRREVDRHQRVSARPARPHRRAAA